MKIRSALLCFFVCPFIMQAQTGNSNFERLLKDFRTDYVKYSDPYSATFLDGLNAATRIDLNPNNPLLMSALKDWKTIFPGNDFEFIARKLADSIYTRMRNEWLWFGSENDQLKFLPILEFFNAKNCPCLSSRTISPDSLISFLELRKECDAALENDFVFMSTVRRELIKIPAQDHMKLQPLSTRYLYQHCPVFTTQITNYLLWQYEDNLGDHLYMLSYRLPGQVNYLYANKKWDSLQTIFPDHSKFENDIRSVATINDPGIRNVLRQETRKLEMKRIFTVTYYKKGKPSVIIAQAVCEIDIQDEFHPVIRRYQYVPADKIANIELVRRDIDEAIEVPPPPMEVLRQDSLRKN